MELYGTTTTKYDIPLNHLDFTYVSKCKDVREMEKIVKILRSGKEGAFPDLELCAEKQLASIDPSNKLLRKPDTLKTARDFDTNEWQQIDDDLKSWMANVKSAERHLAADNHSAVSNDDNLPPVRTSGQLPSHSKQTTSKEKSKYASGSSKPVKPRDYHEWDKLDIESELKKVDDTAEVTNKTCNDATTRTTSAVSETVDTSGLSDQLKELKAEREKNKGNEAFRAGDFDEALTYYSRSLSLLKTAAAHNNRAQTYLKLKQWNKALDDCLAVLAVEPLNLKALMRRAVAYKGLTRYVQAKRDLEYVLDKEPNNKQAQAVMTEVDKILAEQKVSGRRMVIEEVEGSSDEDAEPSLANGVQDDKRLSTTTEPVMSPPELKPGAPCIESSDTATPSCESEQSPASSDVTNVQLPPAVATLKESGNELFRRGQYGDALDKYNAAVQLLDGMANMECAMSVLFSNRAACLMKLGDCQGCIADCDSALALTPAVAKPLLRRAMAFEALEKYRKAFVDYRHVLSLGSNVDVAQQGSDRCAAMLQRLDGPDWRQKLPPSSSVSSLTSISSSSSASNLANLAESTFETCKSEGNTLFTKGEFTQAVELFSKCIELFPNRVVPYTNRALCYLRLLEYESVLSDCNQALSLEFHNIKALFRRAQAYKMLRRYEESLVDLETLLKIDTNNTAAKKELQLVRRSKEDEINNREKRLEACLRKQRQRVHIEEVDDSSSDDNEMAHDVEPVKKTPPNSPDPGVTSSQSADPPSPQLMSSSNQQSTQKQARVIQLSKVTAFEFMQAWNGLKHSADIVQYVQLLDQIQPSDVPKVVSNQLDSSLLVTVIRCCSHLVNRGDHDKAFEFLSEFSNLPRFDTIVLFLSHSEKKDAQSVFAQMHGNISDVVLGKIQKKYGV